MRFFIFLLFSIAFVILMWKRKKELIAFLFPFVLLRNELTIKKPLSQKILFNTDIIVTTVLLLIECIIIIKSDFTLSESALIMFITTIIIEWTGVILVKIISVAVDSFSFTYDGLFLVISSTWVFLGACCNKSWEQSLLSLVIIICIVINLSVTFRYMIRLCIKREEFILKEFGEVTTTNQVAAIVLLVTTHLYSFTMLIYLLINSNIEIVLFDSNNNAIKSVSDIFYYVIITYTTVGYGDITPQGIPAQIIAVLISLTGFFMSVVVVGIIISTTINKKNNIVETLEYYDQNADSFINGTRDVDFSKTQNEFMELIPENGMILDFGCGSGRDTKCFLDHGFRVEAIDGSNHLCKLASDYTGIIVKHMFFQDLDESEKYDGIWACASILHVSKAELGCILRKMAAALKSDGVIYTSFKYGDFEGVRNGRFFTDLTEESFAQILSSISGVSVEKSWITSDVRPDRGDEKWLNLILRKGC